MTLQPFESLAFRGPYCRESAGFDRVCLFDHEKVELDRFGKQNGIVRSDEFSS